MNFKEYLSIRIGPKGKGKPLGTKIHTPRKKYKRSRERKKIRKEIGEYI